MSQRDPVQDRAEDYLAGQIGRLDDEMATMRVNNARAIADAVELGIIRAVSNPQLWMSATNAIQAQAKARAGGWLFGWVGAFFSKMGLVILALVAIYTLGGFPAIVSAFKAWLASGGQS